MSPIGIGFQEFTSGLAEQRSGQTSLEGLFEEPMPAATACVMPEFKASNFLGKKGTGSFDRITGLVVVTCALALQDSGLVVDDDNRERIGLAIGTSTGSLKSTSDYSRETLIQDRPYLVNPMLFPNTILNCPAAQAAIWHSLKGVNATISGGQLSSLMALRYASTLISQSYADILLVGAVEEFTPHVLWGYHHSGVLSQTDIQVGEGCVVFVLEEPATALAEGRHPLAQIAGCEIGYGGELGQDGDMPCALARCIKRTLCRAGVVPEQVWAVAGCSTGEPLLDEAEEEGLRLAFGELAPRRIEVKPQIGECYSAAGAFQLAAILSTFRTLPAKDHRLALVTSACYDGSVGCALVKECA